MPRPEDVLKRRTQDTRPRTGGSPAARPLSRRAWCNRASSSRRSTDSETYRVAVCRPRMTPADAGSKSRHRNQANIMIGVAASSSDMQIAEEFFELFKTPWERAVPARKYAVILSTDAAVHDLDAELILVYGSDEHALDRESGIVVEQLDGPVEVVWGESTVPDLRPRRRSRRGRRRLGAEGRRQAARLPPSGRCSRGPADRLRPVPGDPVSADAKGSRRRRHRRRPWSCTSPCFATCSPSRASRSSRFRLARTVTTSSAASRTTWTSSASAGTGSTARSPAFSLARRSERWPISSAAAGRWRKRLGTGPRSCRCRSCFSGCCRTSGARSRTTPGSKSGRRSTFFLVPFKDRPGVAPDGTVRRDASRSVSGQRDRDGSDERGGRGAANSPCTGSTHGAMPMPGARRCGS